MELLWRGFFCICIISVLFACAAPQQTTTTTQSQQVTFSPAVAVDELPCAVIDDAEKLTVTYPAESLYPSGAAMPSMEGLACLEVLADWMKTAAKKNWLVSVGGEAGHGYDPQKLAEKRQELLRRYMQRKGIETSTWNWQAAEEEFQLQFKGSL